MKKILTLFIMALLFLLVGCSSDHEPLYIDEIRCYLDNVLLAGKLQYYDGTNWLDYDSSITEKTNVYYSIDLIKGSSLDIDFDIYSPDIEINDMKITISNNFIPKTYVSEWATINEREDKIVKAQYSFNDFDGSFNMIKIYGWLTDNGPKYLGAKTINTNYVLSGVHINIIY